MPRYEWSPIDVFFRPETDMLNYVAEWLDLAAGQVRTAELVFSSLLGTDPSAPGANSRSVTPPGSTPVSGFENGYWVSIQNGQSIDQATGVTETRVQTHVLLMPNGVLPTR